MPRNTFVFITLLSLFAALVFGVNLAKKTSLVENNPPVQQRASPTSPTPTPTLLSYTNDACGVSFSYPPSFTQFESAPNSAVFTAADGGSIILTCQEEIPRPPLVDESVTTIQIGSVSANLYRDTSAKDGTPVDKLIFTHPGRPLDILIAGLGPSFQQILTTITLTP